MSDLQAISRSGIHQIFSHTISDIAHVKYFTGITTTYLPAVCMHVETTYFPWRSEILAMGDDPYAEIFADEFSKSDLRFKITDFKTRIAYGSKVVGFLEELTGFAAVIWVPYCYVSILFLEMLCDGNADDIPSPLCRLSRSHGFGGP